MQICDAKICTGCGACANICPKNCISMIENKEGFLIPKIDKENCILCNSCISHCPQNHSVFLQRDEKPSVLAAYSTNAEQMKKSTSGGIFPVLAESILDEGGCVYGAEMRDDFQVSFIRIEKKEDLKRLQGSKYVQSNTHMIYKDVRENLKQGRKVLFSGLPCQVGGLYSFLNRDYVNLYTIDVVCRGVPSEKLLNEYIKYRENKENSKLTDILFRAKKKRWKPMSFGTLVYLKFKNGEQYYSRLTSDPYYMTFLKNIAMKESCYTCHYNGFPRLGDVTLGDFAGLGVIKKTDFYNRNGISQVLLNSNKGRKLYEDCRKKIIDEERTLDECCYFNLNLWKSSLSSKYRKKFFDELEANGFETALDNYVLNYKNRIIQKTKDILILALGENRVLKQMHKKRMRNGIYPSQWPNNKYVSDGKKNNNEKAHL